ncbi:leucine-rich repeat domain-containing protein [Cohnella faecalis]|uniref:SLH domain-containing protein n=1 Tax=Cohnella faecalis TaxID=2315694 RepID=A0A398CHC5_9BACL|nr:leucine-rich repeat domain-containing protein [Cohnella faecalis]RIE01880.1 hypothetical protein D3H35_13945 [Cohnella faecalis]
MTTKRMKKLCAATAFLMLLLSAGNAVGNVSGTAFAADDGSPVVNFPDANLKKALLEIGVDTNKDGQITQAEMAARADPYHMATGLASLGLGNKNIKDLTGLEYAVNVRTLSLSDNPVTDLTPVAGMPSLESIGLSNTPVRDLSPLGQLAELRFMEIRNAKSLDLSTITSLTHLEFLYADQSNLRDIGPLASLTKLKVLHLFNNQISDISPLANLSDLREVSIRLNKITDIAAFSNKPYMHTLWLSNNQIGNVGGLTNVPSLSWLELDYNRIRDISSFSALTNMRELNLDYNEISDLSPLTGLTKLEKLGAYGNKIESVSPLAGMTKLTNLYLGENRIQDIAPLASLKALKELLLGKNPLRGIGALKNLTGLTSLSLIETKSSDIGALAGLTSLKELNLPNNSISNIAALAGLTDLKELNLQNNSISDIAVLGNLENLTGLWMDGNPTIRDASPILKLSKLTDLKLDKNVASSIAPVVTGVADGIYNTDRVISFNRGTATLNDKPFASGTTVSEEGAYSLYVRDQAGLDKDIHFVIDKQPPVVTGVVNGATYEQAVSITYNEGKAALNGKPLGNGATVGEDGAYTLIVTDEANNSTTVRFTLLQSGPKVRGVASGGLYNTDKVITFDQGTATLDGKPFANGGTVSEEGVHTLVVTGKDGKVTKIVFTIKKQGGDGQTVDIGELRGVSDWAKPDLQYAGRIGLTLPVQSDLFSDSVTRKQFSAIAVKLHEALTGEKATAASSNPFQDTSDPEILKAYRLGIVKGTSTDKFSPGALITREQLAAMLMRVVDQSGKKIPGGTAKVFTDRSKFSSYAAEAIDYMSSIGVISGLTPTTFGPKKNASIEQAVIMAKRLHSLLTEQSAAESGSTGSSSGDGQDSPDPGQSGGTESLYAFDATAFELYVKKTNPQPDGGLYKEYAIRNARSLTLPPYSAIYLTAGISYQAFENESYKYNFGGSVLVANHTDKPMVVAAGAIDYSVSSIYRDDMGTVTFPDGKSQKLTPTGPYLRLIAFDGDFDESKEYKDYLDLKKDLYRGDWMTVKLRK